MFLCITFEGGGWGINSSFDKDNRYGSITGGYSYDGDFDGKCYSVWLLHI